MEIKTQRARLKVLEPHQTQLMVNYALENREHLSPWEPERTNYFYTLENWRKIIVESQNLKEMGSDLRLAALNQDETEVIGVCNFTNIVRGSFQAAYLGYSIAEKHQGKGMMFELLSAGIDYVFEILDLHRVMANHMPCNLRSASVLKRLGFQQEGLAKAYLKINGRWEDHILNSKINPAH